MNLEELRSGINALDKTIQDAFTERMELCKQVAVYKNEHHMQVFQTDREKEILNRIRSNAPEGFVRDPSKWVIFPRLSYNAHIHIEDRNVKLAEELSSYSRNLIIPEKDKSCRKGIATHGISYTYVTEALSDKPAPRVMKVTTPFPFPEQKAVDFLTGLDEVLCLEELDPVIENHVKSLGLKVTGKGLFSPIGEFSQKTIRGLEQAF